MTVLTAFVDSPVGPLFVAADLLLWLDLKKSMKDPLLDPGA